MRIASDGFVLIMPGLGILVILIVAYALTGISILLYPLFAAFLLTAFITFFFRDPDRAVPNNASGIIAPADGKVIALDNRIPGYFEGYKTRLSIFLSMLDVHINRLPVSGQVSRLEYHRGRFHAAFSEKASDFNEHTIIEITNNQGKLGFCQRAGTLARRIVCNLRYGQNVNAGERFGMIRFGSRLDIYMPENVRPISRPGDRVLAGETVIGEFIANKS
jgi:phosphatidylserine decarboxylase